MIPENITKDHILQALDEIDRKGIPPNRVSTGYWLIYDTQEYPPKYVISLANKHLSGKELRASDFHGGEPANNFLEKLGFDIVEKDFWEKIKPLNEKINIFNEKINSNNKLKEYKNNLVDFTNQYPLKDVLNFSQQQIYIKGTKNNYIREICRKELVGTKVGQIWGHVSDFFQDLNNLQKFKDFIESVINIDEMNTFQSLEKYFSDLSQIRTVLIQILSCYFLDKFLPIYQFELLEQFVTFLNHDYQEEIENIVTLNNFLINKIKLKHPIMKKWNNIEFSHFFFSEKDRKYWIFQSNPNIYNIEQAIKNLRKDTFLVNQYSKEIKSGDKVLFWISGKNAGIIGYGDVLSDPMIIDSYSESEQFVLDSTSIMGHKLRVFVSYNQLNTKIEKTDIQSYPEEIQSEFSILRIAQGTNFATSKKGWDYILKEVKKTQIMPERLKFAKKISAITKNNRQISTFLAYLIIKWESSITVDEFEEINLNDKIKRFYNNFLEIPIKDDGSHFKFYNFFIDKVMFEGNIYDKLHSREYGCDGNINNNYVLDRKNCMYREEGSCESSQPNTSGTIFCKPNKKGIIWIKQQISSKISYRFHRDYINVLRNEILKNKPIDLKLLINFIYLNRNDIENPRTQFISDFKMSKEEINILFEKDEEIDFIDPFLEKIYINMTILDEIKNSLLLKGQIILMGPPGTSKTYLAEQIALQFTNGNEKNVKIVQFHPTYSYEDFIECNVIESDNKTFLKLVPKKKIFREICEEAILKNEIFVLIIDEINRGNVERIFGELIFGLEKRGKRIKTTYFNEDLIIPKNLYIIGTMNTVDLSITNIDAALRRRFYLIELMPNDQVLRNWFNCYLGGQYLDFQTEIVNFMTDLNYKIENHNLMGKYRTMGHSIFMLKKCEEKENISQIWKNFKMEWFYTIRPTLLEYVNFNEIDIKEFDKLYDEFFKKVSPTINSN